MGFGTGTRHYITHINNWVGTICAVLADLRVVGQGRR
jgi:hypothetical protein